MAVAHYLEALDWQKDVIQVQAILGSKNPHPQTFLVGGMAIPVDPNSQNAINADKHRPYPAAPEAGGALRQAGLHPGRAGGGVLLPGLGQVRGRQRRLRFPVLRRFSHRRRPEARKLLAPAGPGEGGRLPEGHTPCGPRTSPSTSPTPGTATRGATPKGCIPTRGRPRRTTRARRPPYKELDTDGQVLLGQGSPLRRSAGRGRPAGPHAGGVRPGSEGDRAIPSISCWACSAFRRRLSSPRWAAPPPAPSRHCSWPHKNLEWLDMLAANMKAGDLRVREHGKMGTRHLAANRPRGWASTRRRAAC